MVRIGMTETVVNGLDRGRLGQLDGASVSNAINRYVQPRRVAVGHDVIDFTPGRVLVDLTIDGAGKYPLVMSKQGQYPDGRGANRSVFRQGDLYVRHGAKSEPATYEDIVDLVDRAVTQGRLELAGLVRQAAVLGEGVTVLQLPTGVQLQTPEAMLNMALAKRANGLPALLDAKELLWCLTERQSFSGTIDQFTLLIRSALRKKATLFFWLSDYNDSESIREVLISSLIEKDRDQADIGPSILEVAALVLPGAEAIEVVNQMLNNLSRKIQGVAARWPGKTVALGNFSKQANNALTTIGLGPNPSSDELWSSAQRLARDILRSPKIPTAPNETLSQIGRLLYLRSSQASAPQLGLPLPSDMNLADPSGQKRR